MFMKSSPILSRIIFWVVLPLILIAGFGYYFLLQALPKTEGVIQLSGLNDKVVVTRDENAVPHIVATTDHDAFFAMGYVHAQERLWQMNYKRRVAQGRVSEILGADALSIDKYMRGYSLARSAKSAVENLDEESLRVLRTYAKGVNAWIQEGNVLPAEFYIFDTKPELWKPEDSILMFKLMALTLGPNHEAELGFDMLVKEVGLAKANEIQPNLNPNNPAAAEVHYENLANNNVQKELISLNDQLQSLFKTGGEVSVGSNAWAVSGKYTKNGLPLLAGDPHLLTETPSLWYLAHLKGDKLSVTGATFPGVPVVFMGRNDVISWGITNMYPDAIDLFMERTNPANPNQYEKNGQWVDMKIEEEIIHVKAASPTFLTKPIPPIKWQIRSTENGPLISDAIGRVDTPLALRWTALDKVDKTFRSYLDMNYAQNIDSFKLALEDYKTPAVNIIYADKENNIAQFAVGKLPIRKKGNGRRPVPGWSSDYEWDKYIPFDEMPHIINPEVGYVINANNKNHDEDYPYILSTSESPPYRYNRIKQVIQEFIDSGEKIEVEDFIKLQGDNNSLQAKELLPFLRNLPATSSEQQEILTQLKEWNGVLSGNSEETAIYELWLKHFNYLLLADDLSGNMLNVERGDALLGSVSRIRPLLINKVVQNSPELKHDWCDQINTVEHESCNEIGLIALDSTIEELGRIPGFSKAWGDINETYFPHQPLSMTPYDGIFSLTSDGQGDRFSVNRADWSYSEQFGYRTLGAAGYRQVIDFSDENLSGFINNTGQSGHFLSKHYDDNISAFEELKLRPMSLESTTSSGDRAVLHLEPKK
ncbi:penicillin acylase family protein [Pseudoalteromonas sp. NJ631]|uniref:penicillin acylase family protein n=1 Tax=Pseudoalteromonas sp. NJ631 TaxID=493915 RepID=UPI00036D2C80|nr:penicillin acylase family protein [Pseudoalteromonas sp. NJ631]